MNEINQCLRASFIYERWKHCRGVKNSKERATWALFVIASGEKDTPIVVGRSLNPRGCFFVLLWQIMHSYSRRVSLVSAIYSTGVASCTIRFTRTSFLLVRHETRVFCATNDVRSFTKAKKVRSFFCLQDRQNSRQGPVIFQSCMGDWLAAQFAYCYYVFRLWWPERDSNPS